MNRPITLFLLRSALTIMKIICYRYRQRKPRYGGISSKNILSGKDYLHLYT